MNSAGEALGVGNLCRFGAAGDTVVAYLAPALNQLGLLDIGDSVGMPES